MPVSPNSPKNFLTAWRYSPVHLLIAIALLLVSSPFVQDLPNATIVEGVLFSLVLLSGLLAVSAHRSMIVGLVLAILALSGQWAGLFVPGFTVWGSVMAIIFIGFVVVRLLQYVLEAREVNHETLCASVAGFLMIGLLWTSIYTLVATLDPAAFTFTESGQTMDGFEAFYYSFVTLSTIGFGDIAPVSRVARMLSVTEAITGMFYVAVLVARLVSIYSTPSSPRSGEHANPSPEE